MKQRFNKLADLLVCALTALLLGMSIALTMLGALEIPHTFFAVLGLCAGMVAVMTLMRLNKWTLLACGCALVGAVILDRLRGGAMLSQASGTIRSLTRLLASGEGSLAEHAGALIVSVSLLAAFIAFLFSRMNGGVYPAFLLFLFVMMGCWFLRGEIHVWQLLPGLIALGLLYARSYKDGPASLRALPLVLAAALLAVLLVPSRQITWEPLVDAADKVRKVFYDYFLFNDPRAVYTVASDGYQPLGETLGGPADPREDEIMRVTTDSDLLLRGSVKRTYTGASWVDNTVNSRYLFIDPTRQNKLTRIFDLDKLGPLEGCVEPDEVSVELLHAGTSTLFVTSRLQSLSIPLDQAAYFNDAGEVFIARDVEPGDGYSFTAYRLTGDLSELTARFDAAAQLGDSSYAGIQSEYMNLPSGLEDEVYWLTMSVVEGIDSPLEKALAMQKYLRANYAYATDVPYPPQGRDFVSYFLLDQGSGYCTYFASAMAVMARLAGLPSRYVEGYLVRAQADGETIVRGIDAHAWVEIYFEGIGWVSFDPTPGQSDSPEGTGGSSFEPPATPEPTPTPTPDPAPSEVPPQMDDTLEETPTPEPEAGESTPTPEPEDGLATPTPEPENQPDESDSPDNQPPENRRRNRAWLWVLLIVLLFAALTCLAILRAKATQPERLAQKEKDASSRLMLWYRAILSLLAFESIEPQGGESPVAFASRLVKSGEAPAVLIDVARAVSLAAYSAQEPDERTFSQAAMTYRTLESQMKKTARARYALRRMLRGIGDYRQIP